jgi:hypothetical protein
MTTEELAAAGLPAEPVAQNPENVQPAEEQASPAASESKSHEDGEVRTDDEDVGDVDADVRDLVRTRPRSVDAKSALNANHTASRTKLASHAQRANDVPVNFS